MAIPIRLQVVPVAPASASTPDEYRFAFYLLFAAPLDPSLDACALASLDAGDGTIFDLGNLCAPTAATWREQRRQLIAEHTYAEPGEYNAIVRWGDQTAEATVITAPTDSEPSATETPELPTATRFQVRNLPSRPLEVTVDLAVTGMRPGDKLRIDGGAFNVRWWEPPAESDGPVDMESSWTFGYPKPGLYQVAVEALDADGFWLATLGVTPIEISPPIREPELTAGRVMIAVCPIPPEMTSAYMPPTEVPDAEQAAEPWLPYRYCRPQWAWSRTYTQAGGTIVSRSLALGTYLAIRHEVDVNGVLWYQTGSYDWIPSNAVSLIQPSELRGVELSDSTGPGEPPPPPPGSTKRGVVTANVLNVRSGPGITHPVVAQLRFNAEVTIYEEAITTGVVWYRIGEARWVHSGWIRIVSDPTDPGEPPPIREGIVTANALNVRARPGVFPDNPPVATLTRGTRVTIYEETVVAGAKWYRIAEARWVHGGWIQIVSGNSSSIAHLPLIRSDDLATLPVGWVVSSSANVRARPGTGADSPIVGTVTHNQSVRILETATLAGQAWYRIGDDQWVLGTNIGVARPKPRPSSIRTDERWVGVNLKEQTAVAYEGDKPVYAALVATGLPLTPTVQGIFRTWIRFDSRKMSGGSPATGGYYYLEEVTWTCYFYAGYALHTAYWHDAFGRPRSHGCVNMSPYDAWWIYRWSAPGGPNSPAVYVYWQ